MQNRRSYFSRKIGLLAIAVFIAATVAVAFGGYKAAQKETAPQTGTEINPAQIPPPADRDLTKVILNVKDMSCSGCISTIKGSLSGIRGIEDVVVDLGGGRAEVYYDHKVLKDVSVIAGAITESGYPADILRTIPPDEIRRERALAAAKAQTYIASVSGRDIARADFNAELGIAKKRFGKIHGADLFTTPRGSALENRLKAQISSRLIDEGILMQEIVKAGYRVDPKTVEQEFQSFLQTTGKDLEGLKDNLQEAGSHYGYFRKKFERKVLISRYLEEIVLSEASNPEERRNMFNAWFANSKALAEVVFYDKDLERFIQNGSASSSCCSAN